MSNTALWDKLGKTDPAHTKQFKRAGGFSGTAIKPMWSYRRMTEEFGPCGIGWGVNEPSFQVVPGSDGEVLVYCTVGAWHGNREQVVYGVGGDKVVGKNKYGLTSDDEAFKKAYTDALTNALKMIGVGADVHMGLFDDSKYVNTVAGEFAQQNAAPAKPISAAEMKRGLEAIKNDLLDCKSIVRVNQCAQYWGGVMRDQNWSKDYREEAIPLFAKRRDELVQQDEGQAA